VKRSALLGGAIAAAVALVPLAAPIGSSGGSGTATAGAATLNPVAQENLEPGDPSWQVPGFLPTVPDEHAPQPAGRDGVTAAAVTARPCSSDFDANTPKLEGYASATSVNKGGSFTLQVRALDTAITKFDATIYRQGWYNGAGGTRVAQHLGLTPAANAVVPAPDPASGRVALSWPSALTVQTGNTWVSGVYIIVLSTSFGAGPSTTAYVPFIVRDDASSSKVLFVLPTSTWQAYNEWGGKSLYDYNSKGATVTSLTGASGSPTRATQVSFDRPYCGNLGAGVYLGSDQPMLRFLEREGYDVTYAASEDLEANANLLKNHKVFLTTWHDEYYSVGMRQHLVAGRDAGTNLAFFTANSLYQQIRWANGNRTIVAYKDAARDPGTPKTDLSRVVGAPENQVLGGMFENAFGYGETRGWVVTNSSHWLYGGTGLHDGDQIPNLVGYEWDTYDRYVATGVPAGVQKLSDTPMGPILGIPNKQQATIYQAASGASVFNAATMYWSYVTEGYLPSWPADARVQQMTRNVLFQFGGGGSPPPATPVPPVPPTPPTPPVVPVVPGPQAAPGYWMLGSDGAVYPFGAAGDFGDASIPAGASAVDLEPTTALTGYWVVDDRGRVTALGTARGDLGNADLTQGQIGAGERVTSLSATPSGNGYWIFTNRGRAIARGDAQHFGDMAAVALQGPVLDSIPTPTGQGYFMVASDGGIFAFGDAVFRGSMGGVALNAPVQSLVPTVTNAGYWLVASDGGIFAFGDAVFRGSMGAAVLNRPVTGMVRFGDGYLMVAEDGGIFAFSNLPFLGSLGGNPPARPIVAAAAQGT
jgi:hypothetical protein